MRSLFFGFIVSLPLFAGSPWRLDLEAKIQTQLGIDKKSTLHSKLMVLDRYLNSEHGVQVILEAAMREQRFIQKRPTDGPIRRKHSKKDLLGVAVAISKTLNKKQADFYSELLKKDILYLGHFSGGVQGLSDPAMESIRFVRKLQGDDRIELVRTEIAEALGRFDNWVQYDTFVEWAKREEFRKLLNSRRPLDRVVLGGLLHIIGREMALNENAHFLRAAAWVFDPRVPFALDERQYYLTHIAQQTRDLRGDEQIVPYRTILAHRKAFRSFKSNIREETPLDAHTQRAIFRNGLDDEVRQVRKPRHAPGKESWSDLGIGEREGDDLFIITLKPQNIFQKEIDPLRELWDACE